MRIVLLPQAQADLEGIADPLFSRIIRRLRLLERFPEMGASMSGPFADYRSSVVGLYRVVYRLRPRGAVEVAYIRDCRRHPPA